jgi:hypothetical protein
MEMAADLSLQTIARGMIQNQCRQQADKIAPNLHEQNLHLNFTGRLSESNVDNIEGEYTSDEDPHARKIMAMYSILERQTIEVHDVTLAIGGLRLLFSFSEGAGSGSMLSIRCI